jgi:hypothetical protein
MTRAIIFDCFAVFYADPKQGKTDGHICSIIVDGVSILACANIA